MSAFWGYARQLLVYRRLLVFAALGALLDALCAAAGLGSLMWVIDQVFDTTVTARQIVADALSSEKLQSVVGDVTHLAKIIPESQFGGFAFLLGLIFMLTLVGSVGRFAHQYFAISAVYRTVARLRRAAHQRLVHLPVGVAALDSTSDNISKVVRDCNQLSGGFNAIISKAVRDILQGVAALGVALVINWQLTLIFMIGLPVIGITLRKFGKAIRKASRRAAFAYGRMMGALHESLQGIRVVKVHQAEGYERRRFNRINREVLRQELAARTAKALNSPVVEIIAMVGLMVVTLIAAYYLFRAESGEGDARELVKVLLAIGAAGGSFKPLANLNNTLNQAAAAAERVQAMLNLPIEPARYDHGGRGRRLPRHRRSVEFREVAFTYPGSATPAIEAINLHVQQGQTVAIVGGNGSGKTTLLNLLPRLYEPTAGRVLIDEIDIATCTLRSVRRQMAVVNQETTLFEGTIADNIAYGAKHRERAAVIAAATQAHADEFIRNLPEGYDTQIGEAGSRLSGGQRQRLAIARAILRDPAILILDEATSQIDSESEARINDALAALTADRTTFVIAHRLSTVKNADRIVVMFQGRIVDVGGHAELLERCDTYNLLYQHQFPG